MTKFCYEVPFFENANNRCAVAANQMILGFFEPGLKLTQDELDVFTGYVEGKGAWSIQTMLSFADRGYEINWIEEFDFEAFAGDALGYMGKIFTDPDALAYQLANSDIEAEQARANDYFTRNLPFENRQGTLSDVRKLLDEGYLVRLEVNGMPLVGKDGYCGHMVLAIGQDEKGIIIHNPDGIYGSLPNQYVTDEVMHRSWKEFGGSFALQAVKKS